MAVAVQARTNAIRVFGAKIGVLVFIGDVFKGIVAVLIGKKCFVEILVAI